MALHSASIFGSREKGQTHESHFFLDLESENSIAKSWVHQELWLFESGMQIFDFYTKNVDVSKIMQTWKRFQKLSWCTTTVPNLKFLAYLYPEILTAVTVDPSGLH